MVYWEYEYGIRAELLEWTFQKFPVGLAQVPNVQVSKQMEKEENSLISPETIINLSKLEYFTNLDVPEVEDFASSAIFFGGPGRVRSWKLAKINWTCQRTWNHNFPTFIPQKT